MSRSARTLLPVAALALLSSSAVAQGHPKAGLKAELQTIFHGVSGTVTIIDADTLLVEDFNYDGAAIETWFHLGVTNSESDFAAGLQVPPLIPNVPFVDATFMLELPRGTTVDPYGAVSFWCVAANASLGRGSFLSPAVPNATRAPALPGDPRLTDTAGDTTRGPLLGNSVERLGVALDCTGASAGGTWVLLATVGDPRATALPTSFGAWWTQGPIVASDAGAHTQNVVAIPPVGLVLPRDTSLLGLTLTMQGACGARFRLSGALTQQIAG